MGVVHLRQLDVVHGDVAPDVELGPVADRERPQVLAGADARVVETPQLGALVLRIPLAEQVAEAEDALLGAGLVLVAAGATEGGVELVAADLVQQRLGLQTVARAGGARVCDAALVDRVLHAGHHEPHAHLLDETVAELDHLGEVVARVDVHHRERDHAGLERLLGEVQHDDAVLAAGEQQHGALALGGDLADHEDGMRLELGEAVVETDTVGVVELGAGLVDHGHVISPRRRLVSAGSGRSCGMGGNGGNGWRKRRGSRWGGDYRCRPHSVLAWALQRPARACSPSAGLRVQGMHPIDG